MFNSFETLLDNAFIFIFKVIYSLNTRNDDLEHDLESTRLSYEERLQICQEQIELMSSNAASQSSNLANCDNPSVEVLDTKALNYRYVHWFYDNHISEKLLVVKKQIYLKVG